jgi:hypothetical protein
MIAVSILAVVAVTLLVGARQVRAPGGVRLVAGVTDPSTLKTPQALASWVANLLLVEATVISCAAAALLFVPERYYWLVFVALVAVVVITVAVGVVGTLSRGGTRSC